MQLRLNASDKVLPTRAAIAGAYGQQADSVLAKQSAEIVADVAARESHRGAVMALDHASRQAGGDEPGWTLEMQSHRRTARAFGG